MPLGIARHNLFPATVSQTSLNRYGNAFNPSGNISLNTTAPKFGSASLRSPTTNDELRTTIPHTSIQDRANWTIECWIKLNNTTFSGYQDMLGWQDGGLYFRGFGGTNNVLLEYYIVDKNGANAINWNGDLNGASAENADTWYHAALVYHQGTFILFGNGNQVSTRGGYTSIYNLFGTTTNNNNLFLQGSDNGYLDEYRLSNVARYRTAFTPPTAEFTNDNNTLALYKFNGTNGSVVFEDTSTTLSTPTDAYLNTATTINTAGMALPEGALVGDYAVLFDTSTTTTDTIPSGWTSISKSTTTGLRTNISYKKITQADKDAEIFTGMGGATRKVLLIFTVNSATSSVTVSTPTAQATTATPTSQTVSMSGQGTPIIGFWCGAATGSPSVTVTGSEAYNNISTNGVAVRFLQYNSGQTPANISGTMTDAGTNTFQSFFLKFS
jgi:hypothetical protein